MQLSCTKELIEDINRHVRIYLDTLHNVEKITNKNERALLEIQSEMKLTNENVLKIVEKLRSKYQKQKTNPTWLSHSNCMSLLNLPEMMEEFGPLRNFWEGGNFGEGFLRLTKPTLNKITQNWK